MRLVAASALAATALVVLAVLAVQPAPVADAGTFPVEVSGPQGALWNGTVEAAGTPYAVLLAAADAGGFDVVATGAGDLLFVESVAGHRNQGEGGWCFAVYEAGWVYPQVGAAVHPLEDGQSVRWEYLAGGCPGA